jgi:tRNA-binding protein
MAIEWNDFEKVDMHAGKIMEAIYADGAMKPAFRLRIDFGPMIGIKKSSAQLTGLYTPEALIGKTIIAVTNLPPKQIGNYMSEVLVLGISDDLGNIVLLTTDQIVALGQKIF